GAEGDLDAGPVRTSGSVLDHRPDPRGLGAHDIGEIAIDLRLVGDEAAGIDGRHVPCALLFHQGHHAVAHVGAVLDAGDAAGDGAVHAFLAVRMGGDLVAVVIGGIDDGLD